jgi:hypothetical protein
MSRLIMIKSPSLRHSMIPCTKVTYSDLYPKNTVNGGTVQAIIFFNTSRKLS